MVQHLIVIGGGIEAMLAAGLVARLLRGLCTVGLVPAGVAQSGEALLPPSIHGAHQLLGLENEIRRIGRPNYGIAIPGAAKANAGIPYGRYGNPRRDDFARQWLRLSRQSAALPLAAYSANAALMAGASLSDDADASVVQSVVFGWAVDAPSYCSLLDQALANQQVRRLGRLAAITPGENGIAALELDDGVSVIADLYVDAAGAFGAKSSWQGNVITLGSSAQLFKSPEPFGIAAALSAAARLVNLLPRGAAMPILAAEYRRLHDAEREAMIAADAALMRIANRRYAAPPLLEEHEESYRAAGTLPADGRPWHSDQWLSCFDLSGLVPARYDPNADRLDREAAAAELARWASVVVRSLSSA